MASQAHGMTAKAYLVFDESWDDFVAFHGTLRQDYEPQGAAEEEIVERIVLAAWCLRRAWRAEAAMTDASRPAMFPPELLAVTRYQAHQERALNRAIAQLHRLRAERRRENAARLAARREAAHAAETAAIERRLGMRAEPDPAPPPAPAPTMQATKRSQSFAADRPPSFREMLAIAEAARVDAATAPPNAIATMRHEPEIASLRSQ